MTRQNLLQSLSIAAALTGASSFAACSDDTNNAGDGGDGHAECTYTLTTSTEDPTESLQEALINADAGATICIDPGSYAIERELSLSVRDVTLRGTGDDREDTILDFADQLVGDDGITVTADDFTIENLWIKNTPGNGVVVSGAENPIFRNLKVNWDAGSVTENGAYAVYPVKCKNVLIEDTEIVGAADAGVYVGQSSGAIVRRNVVYGNVAGIEIENTDNADVYDNHTYDNTAGILVFLMPNLEKKDGSHNLIRDNTVENNNRENFAEEGTVVAAVPVGTGMLLLSADDTEIRGNTFEGNNSNAILAISATTLGALVPGSTPDPETDGWLEQTHIHDNSYAGNGTDPGQLYLDLGFDEVEDVLWDGEVNPEKDDAEFCIREKDFTFRSFDGLANLADPTKHITDPTEFECELPPVEL